MIAREYLVARAIELYRERCSSHGMFENQVYPSTPDLAHYFAASTAPSSMARGAGRPS